MITQKIDKHLLPIFRHVNSLNAYINNMVASLFPFSNLQTPIPSSNKSTFHPIADFTFCVVFTVKEKDKTVEKSNSSNVETYIYSAHKKAKKLPGTY